MFLIHDGELFRLLQRDGDGAWIIHSNGKQAPVYISAEVLTQYERTEAPAYVLETTRTVAAEQRLELIHTLTEDRSFISDREARNRAIRETAQKHGTTERRIRGLYFRYLAGQPLVMGKEIDDKQNTYAGIFDTAIRKYYFTAKRASLEEAYFLMVLESYTDADGEIRKDAPTFSMFKHFYYRHIYHKKTERSIARDGLSKYLRNERPLTGSTAVWKESVGAFQMDFTTADIYLVSELSRETVVGRPNICLAVDTATQLIAGTYVGFGSDEEAVMACIANAARDKVGYCKAFGLNIVPEDWPSRGLPSEVIIDQGREFSGPRMRELCLRFGVTFETLPPFRPDEKGCVEKMFDLMQLRYKPGLRGAGVIEPDARERWAADYREQAKLNLREFTEIVLRCVLYLNSKRVLDSYVLTPGMIADRVKPTPANLWCWFQTMDRSSMMEIDEEEIYRMSLPRAASKLTRRGISHRKYLYINLAYMQSESGQRALHTTVEFAYDSLCIDRVYLVENGRYIPFVLAPQFQAYRGISFQDTEECRKEGQALKRAAKQSENQGKLELLQGIRNIRKTAEKEMEP